MSLKAWCDWCILGAAQFLQHRLNHLMHCIYISLKHCINVQSASVCTVSIYIASLHQFDAPMCTVSVYIASVWCIASMCTVPMWCISVIHCICNVHQCDVLHQCALYQCDASMCICNLYHVHWLHTTHYTGAVQCSNLQFCRKKKEAFFIALKCFALH